MMQASKRKNKIGMTLVEIILAMAILSLVVILMTPVLVSGFKMITLSGDRHVNAKSVAGDVENNLAGETVTASLHDISIELPGGIVVDGKSYTLNQGNGARQADLDGYIIASIPFFNPPPPEPPTPLEMVTVDVSGWRNDALAVNRYGILQGTTSAMEYQISSFDGGTVIQDWTICNEPQTEIFLSDHNIGYQVVVRQRTNHAINEHFRIRSAPLVGFHKQGQKVTFRIWDADWRKIVGNDQIEVLLSQGGRWIRLVSDELKLNQMDDPFDENYIYARYVAGSSEDGTTYGDPASFPSRATPY
jgi:competence protein ComGC